MSSQYEVWHVIEDGMLIEVFENDGYAAMRKGLGTTRAVLCSVGEARTRFPNELQKALMNEKDHPRQPAQDQAQPQDW